MPCSPLTITWALSTVSGYGLYGLHLVMQYLRRGGPQIIATHKPGHVILPALTLKRLEPTLMLAQKISQLLENNPSETLSFNHPVLYAIGNDCAGFAGQDRVRDSFNVGCAAIEHKSFGERARAYAKNYDMFIAISRWNEAILKNTTDSPVHLCHQGIDTSLFSPAPSSGLWGDRFIVFSGGKFEFRKGQDIVVAAFKRFQEKHPEALLITSWQNLMKQDIEAFQLAGHCQTVPQSDGIKTLKITPWLLEQGLPQGSFLDIPYTPNMLMPPILRECHAAIFPNRCEGGTNLVAMEAAACGVPTVIANHTGHADLVDLLGFSTFADQRPVRTPANYASVEDWGETDPDSVVDALEAIYTQYDAAKKQALETAQRVQTWDWASQNEKLLHIVCD